jgi:hypothetical protein
MKLSTNQHLLMTTEVESLLRKYKDVFPWSYKGFKKIPPHIVQHWIELDTTISPSHHKQYQINPNYVVMVKHDLDKLLIVGFIVVMEKITWLLFIMAVPKKMVSCAFASISRY